MIYSRLIKNKTLINKSRQQLFSDLFQLPLFSLKLHIPSFFIILQLLLLLLKGKNNLSPICLRFGRIDFIKIQSKFFI